ncbi:uncharacterized protein LOC129945134 [Eupeodes corollae]|uniref:uncharacterized protein LOC129945134 n=1 Tax=Eupeodes corollae TaxID=290404 RepID=UPI0024910923|nr:uncharacterized protein LOC129945134 [Eupeodes corollae]
MDADQPVDTWITENKAKKLTALHWAAKHGNEDVVKLIAGTYKADVNARTNGGYTPLHLAMQFGREDIFALLCNVYKANRDLMDWSGNKPLDYHKQRTSVSASTYSSEYDVFMPQLPAKFRNLNAGGTVGFSRKKRSQGRYATMSGSSLLRNQSIMASKKRKTLQSMLDQDPQAQLKPSGAFSSPDRATATSTNNNNDVLSSDSGSPSNNYYGKIPSRRKESFLRKTFRAASNRSEMVTNNHNSEEEEIKARRKHTEKDLGFLRIGSLNVRVKKTTEAFSNFLGVGNGNGNTNTHAVTGPAGHQHHPHHRHHPHAITAANPMMRTIKPLGTSTQLTTRASVPINTKNKFEKIHKTWGSADNIPRDGSAGMPPPQGSDSLKTRKTKRNNTSECRTTLTGYSSMPTTPNQLRAPIGILSEQVVSMGDSDSDVACGFGSNWSVSRNSLGGSGSGSSQSNAPAPRYG